MKKYYLETLSEGCPKNILESATYRKLLDENGFEPAASADDTDLILLNTCGCLETIQERVKTAISTAAENTKNTDKRIIVAGCYPLIDKENRLKELSIDTFPPGEVMQLKNLLSLTNNSGAEANALVADDWDRQPSFVTKPNSYFSTLKRIENSLGVRFFRLHNFFKSIMMTKEFHYVTIGKGCLGNCTFCGIKLAIGNPVSRRLSEIVNNVRKGILNGKRDIWLVSDDVGCWGQDINLNSAVLLKEILAIPAPMNLVVNYFEPEMFLKHYEELKPSLTDPRIIQICIPLQTGSQKLLKKMGRHYDIKEVLRRVAEIKQLNPGLIVKTQYITSFPGESWWDFFCTLRSMRFFDGIGVNTYARLKFTPAYKLRPLPPQTIFLRKKMSCLAVNFYHVVFVIKSLARIRFRETGI